MSEIVQLYDFRKRRLADTAGSRVIMAIQNMTEAEQRSFIDHWDKLAADRVDKNHKTPDREKRKELWRKAEAVLEFYDHLQNIAHSAAGLRKVWSSGRSALCSLRGHGKSLA
jgi:hypothetical protein